MHGMYLATPQQGRYIFWLYLCMNASDYLQSSFDIVTVASEGLPTETPAGKVSELIQRIKSSLLSTTLSLVIVI